MFNSMSLRLVQLRWDKESRSRSLSSLKCEISVLVVERPDLYIVAVSSSKPHLPLTVSLATYCLLPSAILSPTSSPTVLVRIFVDEYILCKLVRLNINTL